MKLFVSYSHDDSSWLDRLSVHMAPAVRSGLDVWDDRRIAPGMKWRDEIAQAIANADGAILLVSAEFLASEFVANEELPQLLREAKSRGAKVFSLIIGSCLFSRSPLSEFQALNDPSRPLKSQRRPIQEKVLRDAAEHILSVAERSHSAPRAEVIPAKVVETSIGTRISPNDSIAIPIPESLRREMIRVSISGLFRIRHQSKFLLIWGNRISHFQPIGGVFKRWNTADRVLAPLGVRDDYRAGRDADSTGDLRVEVPASSLTEFFAWYRSERNRETHPWREFHEELLLPQILPAQFFPHVATERLWTYVSGLNWTDYFQCWEVLVSEIFEVHPSPEQEEALAVLFKKGHSKIRWATEGEIRARGVVPGVKLTADIGANSSWLL